MRVIKDGDSWKFVLPDCKNLQDSDSYLAYWKGKIDDLDSTLDNIYDYLNEEDDE